MNPETLGHGRADWANAVTTYYYDVSGRRMERAHTHEHIDQLRAALAREGRRAPEPVDPEPERLRDFEYEISLGYVQCDICGNSTNHIVVQRFGNKARFYRRSACYGDLEESDVSIDRLIELIDESAFLAQTRMARAQRDRVKRELRRIKRKDARGEV